MVRGRSQIGDIGYLSRPFECSSQNYARMTHGGNDVLIGNNEDLLGRLESALDPDAEFRRPVAFLTGSGISAGAVPMSAAIVKIISDGLSKAERESFDNYLDDGEDDGEKYQQAFRWLGLRKPPAMRDKIIQLATLAACDLREVPRDSTLIGKSAALERELDRWRLPAGQEALGRLIAGLPHEMRGPVLTTNFDPLTEIAIRKAGAEPVYYVNADDSSFLTNLRVQSAPSVLHLHGYWRDSVTLSMTEQLEAKRPAIEACLRHILENYTLVVLAYGGWSDVVTRIFQEQMSSQQGYAMDVLWGFRGSAIEVRDQIALNPILSALDAAQGNIQFYHGVDTNEFLPELERRVAGVLEYPEVARQKDGKASLLGWINVTDGFLQSFTRSAGPDSAITFLDGRLPAWADAMNPSIVRRDVATEITNVLESRFPVKESSVEILLGASGEGKSTVLLQVAADLARRDASGVDVLYLSGDYFGSAEEILGLPLGKSYVLIIDDAYRFTTQLQLLVTKLRETGKPQVHLLLASGDSDWYSTGAARFPWSRQLRSRVFKVSGLERPDAVALISVWRRLGPDALGELQELAEFEDQVSALLEAAADPGAEGASLLGALLETRYGPGLRDHIAQLMDRLEMRLIRPGQSDRTLLDALIVIALPHAYGVVDLEPVVLSNVLRVDWASVVTGVLEPLGAEAAISYTSGRVVVRHQMIANVILDLCLEREIDLEKFVDSLVFEAAKNLRRHGYTPYRHSIAYLGARMIDIPRIAKAAVGAVRRADPLRLSYVSHASSVYRKCGDALAAQRISHAGIDLLDDPDNWGQIRGYLTEWAVVEGNLGNWACNAWLASAALRDAHQYGRLHEDQAQIASACLMIALRRLDEQDPTPTNLSALAAVAVIVRRLGQVRERGALRAAERRVDERHGTFPDPFDPDLLEALREVHASVLAKLEYPIRGVDAGSLSSYDDLARLLR